MDALSRETMGEPQPRMSPMQRKPSVGTPQKVKGASPSSKKKKSLTRSSRKAMARLTGMHNVSKRLSGSSSYTASPQGEDATEQEDVAELEGDVASGLANAYDASAPVDDVNESEVVPSVEVSPVERRLAQGRRNLEAFANVCAAPVLLIASKCICCPDVNGSSESGERTGGTGVALPTPF